MQKILGNAAIY